MPRAALGLAAALTAALAAPSPAAAQNNGLPTAAQSVALMTFFADKGRACGMTARWQSALIKAMSMQEAMRFDDARRAEIAAQAAAMSAERGCEDPALNAWLEAAGPNMEAEGLSNYLAIYRALALMEDRPAVFDHVTLRGDYAPAVAAIDAQIAAMAADGRAPEGGGDWDAFVEETGRLATEAAAALRDGEAGADTPPALAAAWIAQSALIVELWLEEALAAD